MGRGVARIHQPDPFCNQGIRGGKQKREDAAEHNGNEPDSETGCERREPEHAGGVPQQSERARQIEVAKRGRLFAKTVYGAVRRQHKADAERQGNEEQGDDIEFLDGWQQSGEHEDACRHNVSSVQLW